MDFYTNTCNNNRNYNVANMYLGTHRYYQGDYSKYKRYSQIFGNGGKKMKLWIRSKERDILQVCNSLSIQPIIKPNKKHQTWGVISNFGCVGEYGTRERCLEILDEIQELLKLGNPENSFMHIRNSDMGCDETLEVLKRAREIKAIVTCGADFEVVMPSVITYEMPEK